jgi:glycosyltransferase involved in cell wall biosynthesis/predicted flap endonuclease-1-like 5' DNA nuclease
VVIDNLTIVVPFWNGHATLARLVDSLPAGVPLVVVDDHSDTPPPESDRYTVIRPTEKGFFTGAVNAGLAACQTDVLVLNQDAALEGTAALDLIARHRAAHAMIGERIKGNHPAWPNGYIHGTFMFLRRDAVAAVGPMNAADYPLWGSTCEYQLRLCRRGFKVLALPHLPGFAHDRPGRFGEAITEALRRAPQHKDLFIRTPPMISVVVPCFNYGRFLADCIASLIGGKSSLGPMPGQTFQSFDVVIVDDASTDDTPKRAAVLADDWKGIRYVRLGRNSGTAAAINAGVRATIGRYVTVLSADDMAEPWHLEELLRAAQANPHSVVYSDLMQFGHGKRVKELHLPDYEYDKLLYKNCMGAGILYPRAAWEEAGGYPEVMSDGREDWAFNVALGIHGYCGVHVHRPGYLYRREGHNRSLQNMGPQWRNRFQSKLMALFPAIYAGERPMACCGGRRQAPKQTITKVAQKAGKAAPAVFQVPGQGGMALLEYVGLNVGTSTWYGPVTGTRYEFGANPRDKIKYVDARDVAGMLVLQEGTRTKRPAFRRYNPPPPAPPPAPAPVPAPEPEPVVEAAPVTAPAAPDPDDLLLIRGVGKALAGKLAAAGYRTFVAIAEATPGDLAGLAGIKPVNAERIIAAAAELAGVDAV